MQRRRWMCAGQGRSTRRRCGLAVGLAVTAVASGGLVHAVDFGTPTGFAYEAAALCTDVVNETASGGRADAMQQGLEAWLDVLATAMGDGAADADFDDATELLTDQRDAVAEVTEILESFNPEQLPDDEATAAWTTVVAAGHDLVALLDERAELLAGDPAEVAAGWSDVSDLGGIDPAVAAALGGEGRDCLRVYSAATLPDEPSDLYLDAARACSDLVSLWRFNDVRTDADAVLSAVALVHEDDIADVDWPIEQARRLGEFHDLVADRLESVTSERPAEDAAWDAAVEYFRANAVRQRDRAEAMSSGDAAAIRTTMAPGYGMAEPGVDWATFGLDTRDCSQLYL